MLCFGSYTINYYRDVITCFILVQIICDSSTLQLNGKYNQLGHKAHVNIDHQATPIRLPRNEHDLVTDREREDVLLRDLFLRRLPTELTSKRQHNGTAEKDDEMTNSRRKGQLQVKVQQKRYFCKQRFNFNPVAGRCQPNLAVGGTI